MEEQKIKDLIHEAWNEGDSNSKDKFGDFLNRAAHKICIEQAGEARAIFEETVCPLCYQVNPQHADENNGKGCNYCPEKELWTGQTWKQALQALKD